MKYINSVFSIFLKNREKNMEIQKPIPVFHLHNNIIFPNCELTLTLASPSNIKIAADIMNSKEHFAVLPIYKKFGFFPQKTKIAILSKFSFIDKKGIEIVATIKGIKRIKLTSGIDTYYYPFYKFSFVYEEKIPLSQKEIYRNELSKLFKQWLFILDIKDNDKLISLIDYINSPGDLVDFIAHYYINKWKIKKYILEELDEKKKVSFMINLLEKDIKKMQ